MSMHPALDGEPIYLDYNATTPVDPAVVAAMQPYLDTRFGNPSSAHRYATAPAEALATARGQVAALIGGDPAGIAFTGSGSEADNLAIRGIVLASPGIRRQVITQATEHPAWLATCHALQRLHGVEVTVLPVDRHGLAAIAHAHGALVHTDAAQAAGKIPIDVGALDVDLLTVAGHKMYAPKGIAALYVRPGLTLEPVVYGGGQEHGLCAGTENVAYAVALGAAADLTHASLDTELPRLTGLRDRLHRALDTALPGAVHLNGHPDRRLPNTVNVSVTGVTGNDLLAAVPELAASTGSACHSGTTEPSPVLTAMGFDRDRALGAVRLSLGRWTTTADVDRAADLFAMAATGCAPAP